MRQINNVYQAVRFYKNSPPKPGELAKWKKEHADVWAVVDQVDKLRANG